MKRISLQDIDLSKPASQQGGTRLGNYDGSRRHPYPKYEVFCQIVSESLDPERAMQDSGIKGRPQRGWRLLKDQTVAARLAFLGVDVEELLESSPSHREEAEATPDSPEGPGEELVEIKSYTRADIIRDIEQTLSCKGKDALEGRERLAYLEKLAKIKGFEGQEADDRPPEPCHLARYITQWAGHGVQNIADTFPDGEAIIFRNILEFTGWTGADLETLSLEYEEEMAKKAKDSAGELAESDCR